MERQDENIKNYEIIEDNKNWKKLITNERLNLKETLFSGQVFNFIQTDVDEYTGTLYFFVAVFKNMESGVYFKILHTKIESTDLIIQCINRFFTLQINYKESIVNISINGLRLITNSLIPTIFSFICSANNNVKRISKMVTFLYSKGEYACTYKNINFYLFPDIEKLINIEEELKNNGFGYRSKYISKTAEIIARDSNFEVIYMFDNLILKKGYKNQSKDLEIIRSLLIKLSGVGPKVRDCISLMGLGLFEIVPIDTHIFKHARKLFNLEDKSLNSKNYNEIQKKFVEKFGSYAGIYQLFIFKEYLDKK